EGGREDQRVCEVPPDEFQAGPQNRGNSDSFDTGRGPSGDPAVDQYDCYAKKQQHEDHSDNSVLVVGLGEDRSGEGNLTLRRLGECTLGELLPKALTLLWIDSPWDR